MKPVNVPNKQIFEKVIETNEYAIGALLVLYSYQTPDEQLAHYTAHQNGEGFNSADSNFASSLAQQYLEKGRLTEKQLAALKKLLPKYHNQVKYIEPMKLKRTRVKKEAAIQKKQASLVKNTLILSFPFDWDTVNTVKTMSGRKWNKEKKQWSVPLSLDSVDQLMMMGFKLEKSILDWYNKQTAEVEEGIGEVPGLKTELYPFQDIGVKFIDMREGRALIGDDMGLGKTVQALAWLQLRKDIALPALIVAPSSAKGHWVRKTEEFTELAACSISGRDNKEISGNHNSDVFVINYDIIHETAACEDCEGQGTVSNGHQKCRTCKGKGKVAKLDSWLTHKKFKTVVFDEIHYTKNKDAGRTIAAMEISKSAEYIIGLSGTPITNRPVEFYNAINMINDKIFPSWWKYTGRYCDRKNNGFGVDVSGASNTDELHRILTQTIMLRRLKKDVLKQLPPKVRSVVPIEIDQNKYAAIIEQAEKELAGKDAEHLTIIERAKQAVVNLKIDNCIQWIKDYIENDRKLVVFADHHFVIERLMKEFEGINVTVYGGTSPKDKDSAEERFQTDPNIKLFIGSKAAKESLTLTAASATCFLEMWWTPGDHDQAEDRVHRIGQEADSVFAYYLLAENTIEEDIAQMLDQKREVLAAVLDGKKVEDFNMLHKLMKTMFDIDPELLGKVVEAHIKNPKEKK